MKKLLRLTYSFVLIAGTLTLLGFAGKARKQTTCKDLIISIDHSDGNFFINEADINNLLLNDGDTITAKNLGEINTTLLEENIELHSAVAKAEVYSTINGEVHINVSQRNPVARVFSNNQSYYIDSKGDKMDLSPNYSARVLPVRGSVNDENLQEIFHLVQSIRSDTVLEKQIVEIICTKEGYKMLPRKGNHVILLGKTNELEKKLMNLKLFYSWAFDNNKIEDYKILNLKFTNQVVCTKR